MVLAVDEASAVGVRRAFLVREDTGTWEIELHDDVATLDLASDREVRSNRIPFELQARPERHKEQVVLGLFLEPVGRGGVRVDASCYILASCLDAWQVPAEGLVTGQATKLQSKTNRRIYTCNVHEALLIYLRLWTT